MRKCILNISDHEYLLFESAYAPMWQLDSFSDFRVSLCTPAATYKLAEEWVKALPNDFAQLLDKAINKKLKLDKSVKENVGLMWNRLQHGDTDFVYEKCVWVGIRNMAFTTPANIQPNVSTWIYNKANGTIVLEVTENYFWHYLEKDKGKNYETYEAFIKRYKPLAVIVIPEETAKYWLKDVQALVKHMEEKEAQKKKDQEEQIARNKKENRARKRLEKKEAAEKAAKKAAKVLKKKAPAKKVVKKIIKKVVKKVVVKKTAKKLVKKTIKKKK